MEADKNIYTTGISFLQAVFNRIWYGNRDSPLNQAIANMNNNKFLISYELNEKNRAYTSFTDSNEFINIYKTLDGDKHYYEVLYGDVNLYFDLDFKIADYSREFTLLTFTEILIQLYYSEFGKKLNKKHIYILDASDEKKGSLHFNIINGLKLRNPKEMKTFAEKVNTACIGRLDSVVDTGVYTKNRNFRLIQSRKFGSNRDLVPISLKGTKLNKYSISNYIITNNSNDSVYYYPETETVSSIIADEQTEDTDGIVKKAISLYSNTEQALNHNLETAKVNILVDGNIEISFKRMNSSHCISCDRTHDRDNTSYLLCCVIDNKVFEKCYKSDISQFLGNIIDEPEPTLQDKVLSFIGKAITVSTSKPIALLHSNINRNFIKTGATVIDYNTEFCSLNNDLINSEATIIAQRASMGTGKTNAAALRALTRYNKPESRYILLSFRITLAEQLKNEKFAKDKNLKCYNESKGKIKYNKLVIQPESLHRYDLKIGNREYLTDEIIIDEISQVRKQFTSATFLKQPNAFRSYQKFKYIIKNSKHIHIMDANLTSDDISWIQGIRDTKSDSIEIYWNKFKNFNNRKISITGNETDIIYKAIDDLRHGRRVYIASNSSTEKIITISELIKNHTKAKTLCICSDTLSNPDVKTAIGDPNRIWENYDLIICSPSVQSGISFDKPDTFHSVYGIFGNFSSGSSDCEQMLNRIRHPTNSRVIVSISMRNNNIGSLTKWGILNFLRYNRDHINKAISDRIKAIEGVCDYELSKFGFNEFKRNDLFNLIIDNELDRNKDLNFFIWNFIRNHHLAGYNVSELNLQQELGITNDEYEKLTALYRESMKLTRDRVKSQDALEISEAVNRNSAEIEAITKKLNSNTAIDKSDMQSLSKYNITSQYGVDINQTADWFKLYGDKKIRNIYNNQNKLLKHDTFEEAVEAVKLNEMKSIDTKTNAMFADPESDIEYVDAVIKGVVDYTTIKPKYKKYKTITEMIEKLGFKSIDCSTIVNKDIIKNKLQEIHNAVMLNPEHYINALEKDRRKIEAMKKWKYNDDDFDGNMLKFVNGSIRGEFGVSIASINKKSCDYILKNKYLDKDNPIYFNNINRPLEQQKTGSSVPNIGENTKEVKKIILRYDDGYDDIYDPDDEY